MAKHRFLEVTYRNGRKVAAYFYLQRRADDSSVRSVACDDGLVVDYAADGRAIGVEITAPSQFTLPTFNAVLAAAGEPLASADDIAPLLVATMPASGPASG